MTTFQITYRQGKVTKLNVDIDFQGLFDFISAHNRNEIVILSIEDSAHHNYCVKDLTRSLK